MGAGVSSPVPLTVAYAAPSTRSADYDSLWAYWLLPCQPPT